MSASAPASRCSILVVEDEPLLAMEIELLLSQAGFDLVGPAFNVRQAMRVIEDKAPDLTVVDLNLGGEMAIALLDFLSERAIPFVVLSGHSPQMVPAQHRDRPFLQKPCQPEALLSKVRGTLSEPRSGALCA
jgi:DNA-binding NtrC family response regulator